MSDKKKGLYNKYKVERTDGKPMSECIVLEFKDKNARAGILAFAKAVKEEGYEELYQDLEARLDFVRRIEASGTITQIINKEGELVKSGKSWNVPHIVKHETPMQTKDKSHTVSFFNHFDLVYENDLLALHEGGEVCAVLTPEVARQMKMIIDLFLIDQYQV